jgi:tyrosinase
MIQRVSNTNYPLWTEYIKAIQQLINDGTYAELVDKHRAMKSDPDGKNESIYFIHGSGPMGSGPLGFRRFLPWHRAYLVEFEKLLRSKNPNLSIPYWDWTADQGQLVGIKNYLGLASLRSAGIDPSTGNPVPFFTDDNEFQSLINFTGTYYDFTEYLETRPHNAGHGWAGGDMGTMASPNDPLFWMHHAQVDRIWHLWQQNNPGEKAYLMDDDKKLHPWEAQYDIDNIDDISNLGTNSYEYV